MPLVTIANTAQQMTMAGVWMAAIGILGLLIRQVLPWRKQASDAEARLRDSLIARVERLEVKLERKEARYAAKEALSNHKLRNVTACFDAMLMMLEMNPDRGPDIVKKIKEMRASQMAAEAQEAAIIRAAEMKFDEAEEIEAKLADAL